jgi:hypothetical protein
LFILNENDQKTVTMKRMQSYVTLHSVINRARTKHIRTHYKQLVTNKHNMDKKKNEMWFHKVAFSGVRENI